MRVRLLRSLFFFGCLAMAVAGFGQEDIEQRILHFEEAGPPDSVIFYYRKLAAFHRDRDDLVMWLNSYWDLQAYFFEDSERALHWLDTALSRRWRPPRNAAEREALLWVWVNRGYHLFQLGNVWQSVQAYEEGDRLFSGGHFPDFDAVEYLYKPLGSYYTMLGENEKARVAYEKALAQNPGEADALAGLYNNLGITWWNEGDNEKAIGQYRRGLNVEGLSPYTRGLLLSSMARSWLELAQPVKAAHEADLALTALDGAGGLPDRIRARYLAGALTVRGEIRIAQERFRTAALDLEQALDFSARAFGTRRHRTSAKVYQAMGRLYLAERQFPRALDAFQQALACVMPSFRPRRPADQPDPALFHEENVIFEALEGKADALWGMYASAGDTALLHPALDCHRLAYLAENILRESYRTESARLLLQSYRRRRTEKALEILFELHRRTKRSGLIDQAFLTAEQSKASILLENVRENLARRELSLGDSLLARELSLRRLSAFYEKEYLLAGDEKTRIRYLLRKDEVRGKLASLEGEIKERYPVLGRLVAKGPGLAAELSAYLPESDSATLLEYFAGSAHIYVFRLGKGQEPGMVRLANDGQLKAKVTRFLAFFRSRSAIGNDRDAYLAAALDLYDRLLRPVLEVRQDHVQMVTLIPDDFISFIPFEALISAPAGTGSWGAIPFLVRHVQFQYGFSAAVLGSLRQAGSPARSNLLGLAPGFEKRQRGLAALRYSEPELRRLRPPASSLLTGERATLDAFRRACGDYRVLHLSTHARGNTAAGLPGIELADSTLYLPEIHALPLKADLVVLSACETGLGQVQQGEGVMSLSRAFAYAGAASLVASLWQVNEESTARLMSSFYDHLRQGLPRAKALRQAKLDYLADSSVPGFGKSPYYWAGFIYSGSDTPLVFRRSNSGYLPAAVLLLLLVAVLAGALFRKNRRRASAQPR